MYIIAGLGNPDEKYRQTRHNIGFDTLDRLADRHDIRVMGRECQALVGKGYICGCKVILVKPQTYMNNSGDSLRSLVEYYKADPENEVIIIYDDIALPVGKIRVRPDGSAGGHNGIKSIIGRLGTEGFSRVRIGVGQKPEGMDLAAYVLGRFSSEDRTQIDEASKKACDAIETILTDGIEMSMNRYN